MRTAALGGQPRHGDAGLPRRVSREPARRHAGAVPGGRLPGPGEVRLPQRRRRRARAGRGLVGRTVFCLHPHQTAYVVPAAAVTVVPDGVPRGPGGAGRDGRDRRQRAVGRPPAARRPGRGGRRGDGRVLRRAAAGRRSPGSSVTLVDVDPSRVVGGGRPGRGVRPPSAAPGRSRPRRAHVRHLGRPADARSSCWRRTARSSSSAGTATRRSPSTLGGAFHSRRLAVRASQVGEVASARRGRRTHAERMALALDLLRDPALRRAADGGVAPSTTCPT